MAQTTKTKKKQAASAPPEWVAETPEECSYLLEMYDPDGTSIQTIEMTRAEFCALKEHLAKARGYDTKGVAA